MGSRWKSKWGLTVANLQLPQNDFWGWDPSSWRHAGGWGRAVSQVRVGYPQPALGEYTVYARAKEFRVARYPQCSKVKRPTQVQTCEEQGMGLILSLRLYKYTHSP